MKYKLYKNTIPEYSALQQILYNRGVSIEKQKEWLNAGWENIYDWLELAPQKMEDACRLLYEHIQKNNDVQILVDSDCDGWTSSAIILNYLYERFEDWATEHLSYIQHEGKQHGLSDVMKQIKSDLVICPDAATNDWSYHQTLAAYGIDCICLDHHECEDVELIDSSPAIIINVQLEDYPNKSLTGAGVAYKFISAFEDLIVHGNQPEEFMDLCALGNCGDMADLRELEIKAIMNVGLSNIRNPFMFSMTKENDYSIQQMNGINYYSMAFYVVPFINAVVRSGTQEEKDIVFKSMLSQYAFEDIESSKRGEKGKMVPLYQEAITVAKRVKRRQTDIQNATVELFDKKIEEENLLDNAILVFKCAPGEVDRNIAGLIANKEQAKYQRPCLVLTYNDGKYAGSGRNYSLSIKGNLKEEIEKTNCANYTAGHANAFGCEIDADKLDSFIERFNEQYKDVDQTPTYWVDYIWNSRTIDGHKILDIGDFDIYGQEIPESLVAVKDISLRPEMITLMGLEKGHPTLKIQIGNISIIKFRASEELYEQMCQDNMVLTVIGKCSKNKWNNIITPQIIVEDMELREEWIF